MLPSIVAALRDPEEPAHQGDSMIGFLLLHEQVDRYRVLLVS
jgi:hypothetical protein